MRTEAFLARLQFRTNAPYGGRDPLSEARQFLADKGETSEGQALQKVIAALASDSAEFSETDVWSFSLQMCPLVSALVSARLEGGYPAEQWVLRAEP